MYLFLEILVSGLYVIVVCRWHTKDTVSVTMQLIKIVQGVKFAKVTYLG